MFFMPFPVATLKNPVFSLIDCLPVMGGAYSTIPRKIEKARLEKKRDKLILKHAEA